MGAITLAAKYLIVAEVEIGGSVDKPDVIGAIFSQTEGLLGRELDLRELQLTGRIGRIEVELERRGDKTVGRIEIPSNLDRFETALVASMIESIDRVGPYQAKIRITGVKDLREEKRRKIVERARELVRKIEYEVLPDAREIIEQLRKELAEAEVIPYGPEKLPAGPEVERSDTVIIVEGRADVLNLLKHGYKNVIAIEGISSGVPKTVVELARKKTAILFVDGDRGGDMVIKEVLKVADIDFIARAPPGKEVEQLSGKEMAKALKNKVSVEEYLAQAKRAEEQPVERPAVEQPAQKPVQQLELPQHLIPTMNELLGTLEAVLYDKDWNIIRRVPVRDLVDVLQQLEHANAIVMDGIVTQRLVNIASEKNVRYIIAARLGAVAKIPEELRIATFDEVLASASKSQGAST